MKLTEDVDYHIYGDKVKLESWLRKYELDELLEALEFYEKNAKTPGDLIFIQESYFKGLQNKVNLSEKVRKKIPFMYDGAEKEILENQK